MVSCLSQVNIARMFQASYDTTMTVLFRWIFVSSLLRIIAISFAIIAIFMVAESFDKVRFIGQSFTFAVLVEYLVLKVPFMISDFMPVIVLIATAIYMTEISHHHELAAIRAAGITMSLILKPLLMVALCCGLFSFAMGEWVEPKTNARVAYIESVYIRGEKPVQHGVQWLRNEQGFMRLTPLRDNVFSLMMLKTDEKGGWLERIDAHKAFYNDNYWNLEQAFISRPDKIKGILIEEFSSYKLKTNLTPTTASPPNSRDMQWLELYDFAQALADAGLDARDYEYQLQRKIAGPLGCILMVVLAYSLCGHMGSRIGANSKGLVMAITLSLVFYIFGSMVVTLTGLGLPVIYAAWWPNILFAGLAGYLLLRKEGY